MHLLRRGFHTFIRNVSFPSSINVGSQNPSPWRPASSLTHPPIRDIICFGWLDRVVISLSLSSLSPHNPNSSYINYSHTHLLPFLFFLLKGFPSPCFFVLPWLSLVKLRGGFSKGFQQNLLAFCPPPSPLKHPKTLSSFILEVGILPTELCSAPLCNTLTITYCPFRAFPSRLP